MCGGCSGHMTCARKAGTLQYECVCSAGYESDGLNCIGEYRAMQGMDFNSNGLITVIINRELSFLPGGLGICLWGRGYNFVEWSKRGRQNFYRVSYFQNFVQYLKASLFLLRTLKNDT